MANHRWDCCLDVERDGGHKEVNERKDVMICWAQLSACVPNRDRYSWDQSEIYRI